MLSHFLRAKLRRSLTSCGLSCDALSPFEGALLFKLRKVREHRLLELVAVGQDGEFLPGFLDDGGVQVREQESSPAVELFKDLTER